MTMKQWAFEMEVTGHLTITVVADNEEEAEEKVFDEFNFTDLNKMFDVDANIFSEYYDIVDSDI